MIFFEKEDTSFFRHSWLRLQSMALHCNRRVVYTDTLHTSIFSHKVRMLKDVSHHVGSRTCLCAYLIFMVIHDERLIERLFFASLFLALFLFVCLSFTLLFSSHFHLFCPEPLLPCGQRQGKQYLRLRQLRSLALGQNSLLPQERIQFFLEMICRSNGDTGVPSNV